MERAEARRLQPHYIESFFLEAFRRLGGSVKQRESRRYEVTHVPAPVRNRLPAAPGAAQAGDRLIGVGEPVLPRYERIAFEKNLVAPQGQPLAAFLCPGHPLLDATIDLTLERHRDLLRRGTVPVDEQDAGTHPRVLFYLEHAIQDASATRSGDRRIVSKRTLYVEVRREERETRNEAMANALQGVDGLAEGHGCGSARLSAGAQAAQGRDLRHAFADHQSRGVGAGEYRGGMDKGVGEGESAVSRGGAGIAGGDGDFADSVRGPGLVSAGGDGTVARITGRDEPHADHDAQEGQECLTPPFSLLFSHFSYAPYLDYRPLAEGLPAAPPASVGTADRDAAQAGDAHRVRYVRRPFQREPDFGVTSVNYDFAELLARGERPA
jgi:hypothetical protein